MDQEELEVELTEAVDSLRDRLDRAIQKFSDRVDEIFMEARDDSNPDDDD